MKKSKRIAICYIEDRDGNLLYGRRADSKKYCLPGGHIEVNEDPYSGCVRELLEETGLEAKEIELVKVSFVKEKGLLLYLFKIKSYEGKIDFSKDPDSEFENISFKDPNDIINEMKVPFKDDIALQYYIEN